MGNVERVTTTMTTFHAEGCDGKACDGSKKCRTTWATERSKPFESGKAILAGVAVEPYDPTADYEGEQTRALDGAPVVVTMPSEDGEPPWTVTFDCDEMIPLDEEPTL